MWSFLEVGIYSKTHNRRDAAVCSDTYEKKVIQTGSVIGLGTMKNVRAGPRYRDPRCCELLRSQIRLKPLGYVNVTEA